MYTREIHQCAVSRVVMYVWEVTCIGMEDDDGHQ
jgi:hypothetical protein